MARPRMRKYGALPVLIALLVGSGVLRLGIGISSAIASEPPTRATNAGAAVCEPGLAAPVAEALKQREEAIGTREVEVAERSRLLELAETRIDDRIAALQAAEAALADTIALADGAAEDDLSKLTAVYEAMKPKDAARLFETMDPDFAAGFLGRMRPAAAAGVLAGMSPEFAYSVSVLLAGRNVNVPKQ